METAENFEGGFLLPWSSQDHLWEHLVLLEKIFLDNELVQVLLLGFSLPTDASCDFPQARQSWQKELKSVCILPHLLVEIRLDLEVFFSQDHSDFLQTLKFPVKNLPQVLELQWPSLSPSAPFCVPPKSGFCTCGAQAAVCLCAVLVTKMIWCLPLIFQQLLERTQNRSWQG